MSRRIQASFTGAFFGSAPSSDMTMRVYWGFRSKTASPASTNSARRIASQAQALPTANPVSSRVGMASPSIAQGEA